MCLGAYYHRLDAFVAAHRFGGGDNADVLIGRQGTETSQEGDQGPQGSLYLQALAVGIEEGLLRRYVDASTTACPPRDSFLLPPPSALGFIGAPPSDTSGMKLPSPDWSERWRPTLACLCLTRITRWEGKVTSTCSCPPSWGWWRSWEGGSAGEGGKEEGSLGREGHALCRERAAKDA